MSESSDSGLAPVEYTCILKNPAGHTLRKITFSASGNVAACDRAFELIEGEEGDVGFELWSGGEKITWFLGNYVR